MSYIKNQLFTEKYLWFVLLVFSGLEIALFMITPFIYKYFIDNVIENKQLQYLFMAVLLYFISYVAVVLFGFLKEVMTTKLSQNLIQKTRDNYYTQLKNTKLTYLNNVKVGSEISVMVNEINDFIIQYVVGYKNVIINGIRIIIGCIVLSILNYKLLIILLLLLPLYITLTYLFRDKINKNATQYNEIREEYSNTIHDGIKGYEDIIIFKKQEWDINNEKGQSKKFIKNRIKSTMLLRAASDISYLFYWGVICIIYYISALNIINGNFTLGLMLVYVAYLENIYTPSRIILSSIASLKNAKSLATNFNNKIEIMNGHVEKPCSLLNDNNNEFEVINFKDINFQYSVDGFNVLMDHITLKAGEKIGFVGESGGGKTTLLKILFGLYQPTTGTIKIDNHLISSYKLREYFTICTQNPHLFSIELDENINFSNTITTDNEFINFVYEQLGIEDFINKKPIELSGGQYHRIALARTLITEAKLYIFDEPTASIDFEKRKSFYKIIDQLTKRGKIIIVSTHSVNELSDFDKVYHVHQGELKI